MISFMIEIKIKDSCQEQKKCVIKLNEAQSLSWTMIVMEWDFLTKFM